MHEKEMEILTQEALYDLEQSPVKYISTFEEAGILTHNKGLVITLEDGSEFQLTIVKSL